MCVYVLLTLCPSWQEDPKSTILMADRLGLHNKIFSGFRSQWMIDSSGVARNNNAVDKNKSYMNKPITFISDYILSLISFAKFLIKQSKVSNVLYVTAQCFL